MKKPVNPDFEVSFAIRCSKPLLNYARSQSINDGLSAYIRELIKADQKRVEGANYGK